MRNRRASSIGGIGMNRRQRCGVILLMALVFLLIYLIRPRPKYPYERRELMTKNELAFYQILRPICDLYGWDVLLKMRLADIVQVRPGTKEYMAHFNRIKAKHTDFILVDPETLLVLCGIELDDPSHERQDRIERDEFVDGVYEAAGIPLLHVWMPMTESELEELLLQTMEGALPELPSEDPADPSEPGKEAPCS